VILNLAVNGRDAMPDGGALTIETAAVRLDQAIDGEHGRIEPGSYVILTVTDDGAGMDTQTQARVFEPFFTTKELGKGTGLGLSTVYGILEQSGGHVRVTTAPGEGTSFEIYLPESEREELRGAAQAEARPSGGSETILLVEDEPSVRDIARRTLEASGYNVLAAANGNDALQLCTVHSEHIDLMVTDVVMPQMRGTELARRVAHIRPGLPVLYMSGYTDSSLELDGGASVAFLQKPFTLDAFRTAVREAVGSGSEQLVGS
jgi:CheY-like chemotaxis protein